MGPLPLFPPLEEVTLALVLSLFELLVTALVLPLALVVLAAALLSTAGR